MNCPEHIPQRFEAADVAAALAERDKRIEELEAELARLRGATAGGHVINYRRTLPGKERQ